MEVKSGLTFTHFYRRRYPRIDLSLPVEYTMKEAPARCLAKSGTIGGGGLMLYLPVAVAVGTVMELKIHLLDHVTVSGTARVVWTELLTGLERDEFKTGVEFKEILEHDLELLRNFIKEQQNPFDTPQTPERW
jgi:c-di-GMP-binding flagellar brake protein YcgR